MQNTEEQFISLRKRYIEGKFATLNDMQRQAVFAVCGPLLILAGAGSGKTTVLVNRIANLIMFGQAYTSSQLAFAPSPADVMELNECMGGEGEPSPRLQQLLAVQAQKPWNIMAITFTNKAAAQLKERLEQLLGSRVGGDVNASTFHAACVRILRRDADKLGFVQGFSIYDADDQQRIIKEIYKQLNIDDKFLPVKAAAAAMGRLKDKMLSPATALQSAQDSRAQLIAKVYAAYAQRCKAAGGLDFDDLIYYTVRLLSEDAQLRQYYQNRYRYVLVDEYQDTSVAQFQLVNLLCGPGANVCVVGDDDQSIYRFRGATIENILSFEQCFKGAKVIRLEENYRSTQSILDAANSVIKNNTGRKGKTLWTGNGAGTLVGHYCAENEQDEAEHIAEEIGRHLKEGQPLRSNAVLYRMNAQSSPVENYFARAGIPYKIVGGLRFNERKEIRDLHAYMSIVENPADELRLRRIINEPSRKIGDVTVDSLAEIAGGLGEGMLNVIENAQHYPQLARAAGPLASFYAMYQRLLQAHRQLPLGQFAAALPDITGYRVMLQGAGEEGITRLENIGQLISNVKTYEDMHGGEGSLQGYLEEIALISELDNYDENADKVVMMTLHAAKGLEFPNVYIVGLEEGIFPSEQARWNPDDIEEERRLCYVGITRAKSELLLSSAASRMLFGQTRRNRQSRFIEEIPPQLINRQLSPFAQSGGFGTGGQGQAGFAAAGQGQGGKYLNQEYNKGVPGYRTAQKQRQPYVKTRAASLPTALQPAAARQITAAGQGGAAAGYAVGDTVQHKVFGKGLVKKVSPVAGDCIVEIDFEKVGVKKTMANFAPLEKL